MIKSKLLAKALYELSESNIHDLDNRFFNFIKKQNLKAQLPGILCHLEKIIEIENEKKGICIETAHEIRKSTIHDIKNFLKVGHLKDNIKIKKELIGGFRAKWQGNLYDASVLTNLKKLEKLIIN